jgi:hypothetical protein
MRLQPVKVHTSVMNFSDNSSRIRAVQNAVGVDSKQEKRVEICMKSLKSVGAVLMAAYFALAPSAVGGLFWNETGDAGELIGTAQVISGSFTLDGIVGTLSSPTDRDIYQIYISDPTTFDFKVTLTSGNPDTILAIFNSSGLGLVYNDNISGLDLRSQLTGDSGFISTPNIYYLAIMGGGQTFTSAGGNIWNEVAPFEVQKAPDGVGGSGSLIGYAGVGQSPDVGTYVITMSGVTPVPEPAFYGVAFAVMGLAVAGIRSIRSRRKQRQLAASL